MTDRELMKRALDDLETVYAVDALQDAGIIWDKAPVMQTITALRQRLAQPDVENRRLAWAEGQAEHWKAHAKDLMKKLQGQNDV